jgi:hypothetical protein
VSVDNPDILEDGGNVTDFSVHLPGQRLYSLSSRFTDIAITGHRRCLTALFALLRHRNVRLAQGEIIPAVIKITEQDVAKTSYDS